MGFLDRFKKTHDSEPPDGDAGKDEGHGSGDRGDTSEPVSSSVHDESVSEPEGTGKLHDGGDSGDGDGPKTGSSRVDDAPSSLDTVPPNTSRSTDSVTSDSEKDDPVEHGGVGDDDNNTTPAAATATSDDGDGDDGDGDSGKIDPGGPDHDPSGDDASTVAQRSELDDIERRIRDVRDEYGTSVKKLMDVKKDLNQKKDELESVQSRIELLQAEIDKKSALDTKASRELEEKKKEIDKIQSEISEARESYDELLDTISKERHALSVIKLQQSETEQSLAEADARLYNAKEELGRQEQFQDPSPLSRDEREFIEGAVAPEQSQRGSGPADAGSVGAAADSTAGPMSSSSVIEAASAVVASLKSKLSMTQKELEAVQLMLVQEREQHEATRARLAALMRGDDPDSGT